jgi:hypothetical protein
MKKFILPAIAVAISIYLLFSLFIKDVTINRYEDYQTVQDQHAIAKGWVPAILPPSAYDIAETHDPDSPDIFGMFKYGEADEAMLFSKLTDLHEQNGTMAWEGFLFHIDKEKNLVKYRNKVAQ